MGQVRAVAALLAMVVAMAWSTSVAAQERNCRYQAPGRTENVGRQLIVFHDPFTVTCTDGAVLRANSGRLNQETSELNLVGDVFFRDTDRSLTADEAIYDNRIQRLWANGNVVFENRSEGSELRGPELEYFRANDTRPLARVSAPRRPTLTLRPGTEENRGDEPMELTADRVEIIGEDDLTATGAVVITRSDLDATSGEARYRSAREELELRQRARIHSDEYDLVGEVIMIRMNEGSLEHVHSRTDARLEGNDARVTADDLQLFFSADSLRQAVAVSSRDSAAVQPRAWSSDFVLSADSIQADFEAQRLRQVHAIGTARAESSDSATVPADSAVIAQADPPEVSLTDSAADSTQIEAMEAHSAQVAPAPAVNAPLLSHDWIVGDTILALFEVVQGIEADSTDAGLEMGDTLAAELEAEESVELRTLIAIGTAQSLYRMAPEDAAGSDSKNINFLVGDRIELDLADGELEVADVQGLKRGIYLEAARSNRVVVPPNPSLDPPPEIDIPADSAIDGVG